MRTGRHYEGELCRCGRSSRPEEGWEGRGRSGTSKGGHKGVNAFHMPLPCAHGQCLPGQQCIRRVLSCLFTGVKDACQEGGHYYGAQSH